MREYFRAMGVLSLMTALVTTATCWSGAAFAVTIPVSNPGFDVFFQDGSGLIGDNRFIDGSDQLTENEIIYNTADGQPSGQLGAFFPTGWQTVSGPGQGFQEIGAIRNDSTLAVPTGTLGFIATKDSNNTPPNPLGSAFTQDVGVTVQPNTIYTLTVNISDPNNFPTNDIIGLSPVIEVDLLAGSTFLTDTDDFVRPPNGETTTYTSSVTTGSSVPAGNLTIRLFAAGASGFAGTVTLFDDVTLDATPLTSAELPGDYNNDNIVDAADYTVWRDNLGAAAGTLPNDTDGGAIGSDQYQTWKMNFGESLSSAASLNTATVPEPATGLLLLLAAVAGASRHRGSSRSSCG